MTYEKRAQLIRDKLDRITSNMTDEEALDNSVLFKQWSGKGVYYARDVRVLHKDELYQVIQPHTSQDDWPPDLTPALFKKVSIDEYPEWEKPTGAHDAYNKDAKCSHFGKRWLSNIDGNIWEPGIPGDTFWREAG